MENITDFPVEILQNILIYLDKPSLMNSLLVCKKFYHVLSYTDRAFWLRKIKKGIWLSVWKQ